MTIKAEDLAHPSNPDYAHGTMTTTNAELIAAFRAEAMPTHDAEAGMAYFEHAEALAAALEAATSITEGRLVDAILSITNHWPEPLTPEEAVGIAVAVKIALSNPEEAS